MNCSYCLIVVDSPFFCRSGLGTSAFCQSCYSAQHLTIEPCYHCQSPDRPEWYFHLPFVNLKMIVTVKLCSSECREKEIAYAREFNNENQGFGLSYQCFHCGFVNSEMKRCSRCKWARYCSPVCQEADWKNHRSDCH